MIRQNTAAGKHDNNRDSIIKGLRPYISLRLLIIGLTINSSADSATCDHAAAVWASSDPARHSGGFVA
jgi:hypothetical protein